MRNENLLYGELADWWHLMSRVEDYEEEAEIYETVLRTHAQKPLETLLEIGSGGGNNAYFMKRALQLTLVDLSADMLRQSRGINPECEHAQGDMRSLRLDREFDAVFIHDAIDYMLTLEDLRLAIETAYIHCRPGGLALFAPDYLLETFQPETDCGGHDGAERGMRYLEWTWDPDPNDSRYTTDYVYLLRHADGSMETKHDRHLGGLFPRRTWLQILAETGFRAHILPLEHSEVEPGVHWLFVGQKAS